ncbi:MAG: hypothetical protein SVK08_00460 [Halobacteriota archaeon]|nr:hypothetical protein [Halobacteriota archaeon]
MVQERVRLRLYIEGIRTRINSIMISSGTNQFPYASVVIPPTEYAKHIPYQTRVHIFEWIHDRAEWVLMFDGYVSKIQVQKTSSSRNITLGCIGYGNLWTRIQKFFFQMDQVPDKEYYDELHGNAEMVPMRSYFEDILKAHSESNDVFEAVVNLLTWNSGGTYTSNGTTKSTPGGAKRQTNLPEYFNRFLYGAPKLANRVVGLETSDEIKKIVFASQERQFLLQAAQGLSGSATLMQLAMRVMMNNFHEMVALAQPTLTSKGLGEYIVKPQSFFLYPPKCNVVHRGFIQSISMVHDYDKEPTRHTLIASPPIFYETDMAVPKMVRTLVHSPQLGGSMTDMSITQKDADYKVSAWEKKYGIRPLIEDMQPDIGLAFKNAPDKMERFGNLSYMEEFLSARSLTVSIDPNMQIVPGASILLLDGDETRCHIIAYVNTVQRVVSADGQSSISVNLQYPRMYSEVLSGYESEVDPLVSSYGELKKLYELMGTEPAFSSNSEDQVRKETDAYARIEKEKFLRDICTMEEFMGFMGLSFPDGSTTGNMTGAIYEGSTFSRDQFYGRPYEDAEPSVLSLTRREIIERHNGVLEHIGIRG